MKAVLALALVLAAALPLPLLARAGLPAAHIETIGISAAPPDDPRADLTSNRQSCVRLDEGESRLLAVYSSDIPADRGISAFEVRLAFDPTLVTVTAVDYQQLLAQGPDSNLLDLGETESDDGEIILAAGDFSRVGIEPSGPSETGPGVLAAVEFTALETSGVSDISLPTAVVADDLNGIVPVDEQAGASIAVSADCPPGSEAPAAEAGDADDDAPWTEVGIVLAVTAAIVVGGLGLVFRLE